MIKQGNIRQWLVIPEVIAKRIPANSTKERSGWILEAIMQRLERG